MTKASAVDFNILWPIISSNCHSIRLPRIEKQAIEIIADLLWLGVRIAAAV